MWLKQHQHCNNIIFYDFILFYLKLVTWFTANIASRKNTFEAIVQDVSSCRGPLRMMRMLDFCMKSYREPNNGCVRSTQKLVVGFNLWESHSGVNYPIAVLENFSVPRPSAHYCTQWRLKCTTKMCPWAYVQRVIFWVLERMLKQRLSICSKGNIFGPWEYAQTVIECTLKG